MFDTKEQEIIKYGLTNGKSQQEVQAAISNYRLGITPTRTAPTTTPAEPNYLQRVGTDLSNTAKDITSSMKTAFTPPEVVKGDLVQTEQNILKRGLVDVPRAALRVVGGVARTPFDIIGELPLVKQSLEGIGSLIGKIPGVEEVVKNASVLAQQHPEIAKDIQNIVDIATFGVGGMAEKPVKELVIKTGENVVKVSEDIYKSVRPATTKLVEKLATPKPTTLEAVGEVLQGTTKDIKAGVKGLSSVDTTGVKTYQELGTKISQQISTLAQKVDADLAVDTSKTLLKDLTVSAKTTGGTVVKSNPIEKALTQLEELYTKIGDDVAAKNIQETLNIAKTQGLTKLEVNDIAKVYGQEFGTKAFGKMGDPLTSVNAQLYENTRKAVKEVARSGINGAEAKTADQTMSNLYRVNDLVKKNIEAVNKISQKIKERGLLEKVGYNVAKYGDILTGGSLRGIVGGFLPRGVGYKVMNALDIEAQLSSNLKIIQEAINSGNDADIIKILKKIDTSVESATSIPKTNPAVGKTVSNVVESPLAQEATKYKSAEEFVKAQGDTLYHGTSAKFSPENIKKGTYLTPDKEYASVYQSPSASSLTASSEQMANRLSGEKRVIEYVMPKNAKIFDATNPKDLKLLDGYWKTESMSGKFIPTETGQLDWTEIENVTDYLKKKGYKFDGIKVGEGGGTTPEGNILKRTDSIKILNPKILKTKSQLIDIYNQAVKGKKK